MIEYFVLSFRGARQFETNFDTKNFKQTKLYIIDNGKQNFKKYKSHLYYSTSQNIGCAGGWNLICRIAFEYLNLSQIIIGQDDTLIEQEHLSKIMEATNENTICGLFSPFFEFSCFGINKKVWEKVGCFDENCIDAYCEDTDYKQRCYLSDVSILNLGLSGKKLNLRISISENPRLQDTLYVNRSYVRSKWGKSLNKTETGRLEEQPPYLYKYPFNKIENKINFIPLTYRLQKVHNTGDIFPSFDEFSKFKSLQKPI